ncbi:MAG: hypothetical protein COW65_13445 [Cytophagales bacterium CG18_big_fil_WC_8_21_14_2_50_42_9]|nr:MAG: hypothetical protein COW65_13445 [Cytophagales bacterium CG18_big_fil_WC_8_21_14_2_50_42_9]
MESTLLQEKIENLPDSIKQQVSDYIDFLLQKYGKVDSDLTDAERQTLEKRYAQYLNNPGQTTDLEEVKKRLLKKHGISG